MVGKPDVILADLRVYFAKRLAESGMSVSSSSQGLCLPRCRKCGCSLSYSGKRLVWFCPRGCV